MMLWKTYKERQCFGLWAQEHRPLGAPGKMPCPWEGPQDLMSSASKLGTQP